METISLFPQGAFEPIERKADKAIAVILALFTAGHPIVVAYSGGKDANRFGCDLLALSSPPSDCSNPSAVGFHAECPHSRKDGDQ
ncbi:hypothetical protein [Cupriavidus pauculus]|uniref:hypothetical protein n=1 Tax=Cupriavidus pauculus TaxID=82633 RepID=UPI000783DAA4|nr:hypothetical protein [Cupriavidus pauculus]